MGQHPEHRGLVFRTPGHPAACCWTRTLERPGHGREYYHLAHWSHIFTANITWPGLIFFLIVSQIHFQHLAVNLIQSLDVQRSPSSNTKRSEIMPRGMIILKPCWRGIHTSSHSRMMRDFIDDRIFFFFY